jgi:tetratricopeptide (TPR) repeat protein
VLALTQRRDEARTHYQQALALLAPIAVAHPGEWAVQQARLYLHQRLGLLLVNAGEQAAALPHIEQAQALLGSLPPRFKGVKTKEKRQAAKPAAAVTQDESAVAPESSDADESAGYANGVLLRARGDLDGALAQFQQELVRLETEAAAKPNDAGMQGRLGSVQMRVGDVLLQLRRHAEAVGHYRAAIAIYANLFARDQANARLSRNLSGSHRKLATTLKSLEAEAEALSHYQQAAELDETLAARQPGYAPALNLAANHQDAARLWETAGDVAAAEHHYRRALIWRTTQAAREPEDATLRLKLSEAHIGLADLVRRQGKTAEAVEQYRQALALAESVEQQTLAQVAARQVRSVCHYRLGECLVKLNDMAGAFDHFQRTAAIREALAAQPDANVTQRLEPMFAYAHLSELHTKLATSAATPQAERIKHWQAARAWHARSLAIVLELRARGLLPAKHLAKPDELARAIAECDTALTELSSAVTAPPHP